jgi:rubrerythrin
MQLSPATVDRITTRLSLVAASQAEKPKQREKPRRVEVWACPVCDKLHEDKSDAEQCCAPISLKPWTDKFCPVCGEPWPTFQAASDCCLWKDLGAPERWAVAAKVEAGTEWVTALGLSPN